MSQRQILALYGSPKRMRESSRMGAVSSGEQTGRPLNLDAFAKERLSVREYMMSPCGPNVEEEMEGRAKRLMAEAARDERLLIRARLLEYINAWGTGDPHGWGDEVQGDDLRAMVDAVAPEVR